jgi:hypothetical protein
VFEYVNPYYFPIDNMLLGNNPGWKHNYGFTSEMHLYFTYTAAANLTWTFVGEYV